MAGIAAPWVYQLKCLDILRTKGKEEAIEYAYFQMKRYLQYCDEESRKTAAEFEKLAEEIRQDEIT